MLPDGAYPGKYRVKEKDGRGGDDEACMPECGDHMIACRASRVLVD